jgi:hypothetical protein
MIKAYPKDINNDCELLARCIEVCVDCAQACTACADACVSEDIVQKLTKCIRSNLDCGDICDITERVLSRHAGYNANITRAVLQACAQVCKTCGDVCEQHASKHDHRRRSEEGCKTVLSAV